MRMLFVCVVLTWQAHHCLYGQGMKEQLQGEWLCYRIETRDGIDIGLEDYLRYKFTGSNLFISNSPVDKGGYQHIKYTKTGFDFLLGALTVQSFNALVHGKDSLELDTKTDSGLILHYSFINQNLIKDINYQKPERRVYRFKVAIFDKASVFDKLKPVPSFKSLLTNDIFVATRKTINSFLPPPLFKRHEGESFGSFFNAEFSLKNVYNIDSLDNCVILDFDIAQTGISNLRIVNRVNYEISSHLFLILEKSGRLWRLPRDRQLPPVLPVRLEFEFITGERNINAVSPKH